jgi:uncharacterized protein (DUF58 family)
MSPVAGLEPPPARQGPGAIPRELVDAVDVLMVRLVAANLPGDRRATGLGPGTELAQLRPYEPGDDVRLLDPSAMARTGQPHVRLHVPERAMTTWIALDLSPSMAFGTALRLKSDVAAGIALVLARLAVRRAGNVGVVGFGTPAPILLPPRGSRPGLAAVRELVESGVAPDGQRDPGGLAAALQRIAPLAKRTGLVAIISDFRGQADWSGPLAAVRGRHTVVAFDISDPREAELPAVGRVAMVDPESGERLVLDTSSRRVRRRFEALERERREALATELVRLRVPHIALGTENDWLLALARGLEAARVRERR